jgi:energy-coupling factor transport system ATP-binding protein
MDDGEIKLQGTPKEGFSNVDKIKEFGLDVPQVTELAQELKRSGFNISEDIIHTEELVNELCQ